MLILNKESTHEKNMPRYSSCNELRSYKNDTHQLKLVRVGKCYANKNKKACYWWQENGTILLRLNVIASTIVSVFSMRFWNISQTQANPVQSVQSIEEGKDQESIQSSTTHGSGHLMRKWQKQKKHHIQESQEVSPFPASDHKAARNRQDSIWNIKNGTNLTLNFDVDQNIRCLVRLKRSLTYQCINSRYIQIKIYSIFTECQVVNI